MKRLGTLALSIALLTSAGVGQTAKDNEQALKKVLLKHQMYLRDFNADSVVQWRWDGTQLVQQAPSAKTVGVLTVDSVKVKDHKVEIHGVRHTVLRMGDTGFGMSQAGEGAVIKIDLKGADMGSMVPGLPDLISYPDLKTELSELPSKYRGELPAQENPDRNHHPAQADKDKLKSCDCATPDKTTCGKEVQEMKMAGITPPKLVHLVDPQYSDEARRAKFSGNVEVGTEIDKSGHTRDFWIARPAGYGLDKEAVEAVRQYVFAPATCDGQAVPVMVYIDVNFQIF